MMSNRRGYVSFLLFFALLLALSGCVEERKRYIRNGKEYGVTAGSFRGRWWNYYERGRSFADGRYYQEAIDDFHKAIQGRSKDQWRARTYGMHFVDYFPHRELAVVHLQRGEIEKAIEELENSIDSAPSAKAHYFLNKARAAQLRKNNSDAEPPVLRLENSGAVQITNEFFFTVKGLAEDDTYVSAITIQEQEVFIELAEKRLQFREVVSLSPGNNSIAVKAMDLAGKTTQKSLDVYCDRTGPQIELVDITVKKDLLTIKGNVMDDRQLASLTINEIPIHIGGNLSAGFEQVLPIGNITILAGDSAGNVTRAFIDSEDVRQLHGFRDPRLAYRSSSANRNDQIAASSSSFFLLSAKSTGKNDVTPPFIKLEGLTAEQESYNDLVLIEGSARDASFVESITVNGEPVLNRRAKRTFFSLLLQLQEGENAIEITAEDEWGNISIKNVTVTRKTQNIRQIGSRLRVALLPFEQKGEIPGLSEFVHDQMIDSFLEQKRFNIVERHKIDEILRELELSKTELVDPSQAVKVGKIAAAQAMLAGSVIEAEHSIEIIGRLIDTESAIVLASQDIFGEDKGFGALDNLLDGLAFKFKRDFPVVEGIILETRGKEVLIDLGKNTPVKPYSRLLCYREGKQIKHPITGKLLGSEPIILGNIVVNEVYEEFSKADVLDGSGSLSVTDKVIVQ